MNKIKIRVGVYSDSITLFYPCSWQQAWEQFEKTKTRDPSNIDEYRTAQGMAVRTRKGTHIYIKKWKGTPHCYAVLVHEIIHAAMHTLRSCGVNEENGEEALCYLADHITERILTRIKSQNGTRCQSSAKVKE